MPTRLCRDLHPWGSCRVLPGQCSALTAGSCRGRASPWSRSPQSPPPGRREPRPPEDTCRPGRQLRGRHGGSGPGRRCPPAKPLLFSPRPPWSLGQAQTSHLKAGGDPSARVPDASCPPLSPRHKCGRRLGRGTWWEAQGLFSGLDLT